MGWPAHDPEGWNEVVKNGIVEKARQAICDWSGVAHSDSAGERRETLEFFIDALQNEPGDAAQSAIIELCAWAQKEVSEAEAAYLTRGVE